MSAYVCLYVCIYLCIDFARPPNRYLARLLQITVDISGTGNQMRGWQDDCNLKGVVDVLHQKRS